MTHATVYRVGHQWFWRCRHGWFDGAYPTKVEAEEDARTHGEKAEASRYGGAEGRETKVGT